MFPSSCYVPVQQLSEVAAMLGGSCPFGQLSWITVIRVAVVLGGSLSQVAVVLCSSCLGVAVRVLAVQITT